MNTQLVPPIGTLLTQMPSGRDMHTVKEYEPPVLDLDVLEAMRAPPDRADSLHDESSSEDETSVEKPIAPAGAFPGTNEQYRGRGGEYY